MMREMAWALRLEGISPQCKLVAIYIGDLASPMSLSTVKLPHLCAFACVDEGECRAAIEELAIATGTTWEEPAPGEFEFHLPLPSEGEPRGPKPPDMSPLTMYVMSCGDRTKIGISKDVASRRLTIQDFNANPVVIEWTFVGPAHLIRRAERAAHKSLAARRIHGEWYTLPIGIASEFAKERLREVGLSIP